VQVGEQLRLAELLAALSVTTDLAMGQAPEKAVRATVVATELARHLGLSERDVADVYYATLLKHLGCTATSHEEAEAFGPDDLEMRVVAERIDDTRPSEAFELLRLTGRGAGLRRAGYVARAAVHGKRVSAGIYTAICEVATLMSDRLGLGPPVGQALAQMIERWDGKGAPKGLRGEEIAVAARIAEPATLAVIFDRLGGPDAALEVVGRRAGTMLDPAVCRAFRAVGPPTLQRLAEADPWTAVLDLEPEPVRTIGEGELERVGEAFGDMVDLKTAFTLGHSSSVADLASDAAERLGSTDAGRVRLAGLFHDLGRAGVGAGIWEKRGPLTAAEWEQVRLHPYHSERILARSAALEPLARIAGMHHERRDGSGYHRGASAQEATTEAAVLAVADAFHAMTEQRAHRPAMSAEMAADTLSAEARSGRFDPEVVGAVASAAGQRARPVRTAWPAGLSDREVEVLRLVARGLSNKSVAADLVISPRTAEHHVQHIYAKIGVSTRAAAAMFAMQHGLLRA
jgi:HD-GYP domain-containing protein (c-di-GMP phosphodiesterase class II)